MTTRRLALALALLPGAARAFPSDLDAWPNHGFGPARILDLLGRLGGHGDLRDIPAVERIVGVPLRFKEVWRNPANGHVTPPRTPERRR